MNGHQDAKKALLSGEDIYRALLENSCGHYVSLDDDASSVTIDGCFDLNAVAAKLADLVTQRLNRA